ncbi:MAG: hypothetical protein ACYCVD_00440 [Desulfitobacteriaceae bacterium]
MKNDVALIEGVFDVVMPDVPTSPHRWGRVVWLYDIEVGSKGKLMFFEDGVCRTTNLSRIFNIIIQTPNRLEIHTESSIYKLRLLSDRTSANTLC